MIIGHQRQIQLLDLHIRTDALSHAYLFTGPRQVGKMTIARRAAASVLCLKRPRGVLASCGTCQSCTTLASQAHPDVFELSPGGGDAGKAPLRIGDIRDLRVRAGQSAYAGKKLFFVDDVSHSTHEAANALLKVLEEPRGDTVFFLIAQQAQDVLPTIRSRAWQMRFWPVSYELLETCLVENYHILPASAACAARLAYGCPGAALEFCSLPPEILKK
ncbi:MAG: DNA polymerase III subunit delta', partial [Parcubacteria group bacterium Gr01-1014_29]